MEIFDNVTRIVKDNLTGTIEKGSRLSIAGGRQGDPLPYPVSPCV
jgi:hypothetical protein